MSSSLPARSGPSGDGRVEGVQTGARLTRRGRDLTPLLVGIITVLVLFVFLVYPLAKTMLSSFVPQGEALSLGNLSLANFERFWKSPLYMSALRNSLVVSLAT